MTHPSASLIAAQHRTGQNLARRLFAEYEHAIPYYWLLPDFGARPVPTNPGTWSEETRRGILAEIADGGRHSD